MSQTEQQTFEFRGVESLVIAKVTADNATTYACEVPVKLAPVAEVGKSTDSASEAHYYDNKALIVVNSESADTISLTVAPPVLAMLSKVCGKSFDETTGMMVDSARKNEYFAIMYKTKGTDGHYRYVSRLKGTFQIPEESNQTENDGTDTTNTQLTYTGIYTEHEFNKGVYDGTNWTPGSAKGIVVDDRYNAADLSNFFDAIQTPDTIGASPSIGQLDLVMSAGSETGKTQVDSVNPAAATGNKLVYKVAADAQTVAYDDALTSGWSALALDNDITATAGQVITVAEVTKTGSKARKVGNAEVILPA